MFEYSLKLGIFLANIISFDKKLFASYDLHTRKWRFNQCNCNKDHARSLHKENKSTFDYIRPRKNHEIIDFMTHEHHTRTTITSNESNSAKM